MALCDAQMGYPCLYPNCKERRKYPIQLVEHVETDHTSREVLERMVIRDKMGNILALPPHCIYRYFPDVGLPPDKVHEIMESITSKDRGGNDPLLSGAQPMISRYATTSTLSTQMPQHQLSSATLSQQHPGELVGRGLNSTASLEAQEYRAVPSKSGDMIVNSESGLMVSSLDEKMALINYLALRQRTSHQVQQQEEEREEPNLVVAGLRQLLSAPHTPLLQQLVVQSSTAERGVDKQRTLSSFIPTTGHGSVVKMEGATSPAPSSTASVSLTSCATPPAPSPDSGRGSESSMEESVCGDQGVGLASKLTQGSASIVHMSSSVCPEENSNDSWVQRDDFSVEAIVAHSRSVVGKRPKSTSDNDKPYACPVPGCLKAYKNMNGIKYHARCAHRIRKAHRCVCNKKYSSEERYLAHTVECQAYRTGNQGRTLSQATLLPPTSSAQAASSGDMSLCASATTTPTLHQLLSRSTTTSSSSVSPPAAPSSSSSPVNKVTTSLPSLPSIFSPTRGSSLLHTLLDA